MSSELGKKIKVTVFGQSHSKAIGCVIDGLPAGITIDMNEVKAFMARRAPGQSELTTSRKEADEPIILSGLYNDKTCDAPLAMMIENTNTRSKDYENIHFTPRPGHADYTSFVHSGGNMDFRGGGHFSGRLTAPLCFAGAICKQILKEKGVEVFAHISSVHGVRDEKIDSVHPNPDALREVAKKDFPVLCDEQGEKMKEEIRKAKMCQDSVGGTIECVITGIPAGIGSPMFDTLEGILSYAMFGVPAVKGIQFGSGFEAAGMLGSENNDAYALKEGQVVTKTNHAGGILGGISNGMPLCFEVAVKPTPSIGKEQDSVHLEKIEPSTLKIEGRHDPCIVPRAVPVIEAVAAIVIADLLEGM